MHILILGHGRDMPGEINAVDPDTRISVLCTTSAVRKVRRPDLVARIVGINESSSRDEWLSLARALHTVEPIDAVGAFGEWHQDIAAAIGADLGAKSHQPDTVERVHNKGLMRRRLLEANVDDVQYRVVNSPQEAEAAVAGVKSACIVKPLEGVGSRGVSLVRNVNEVRQAYLAAAGTLPSPVIVETYLEGPEYSVEMLVSQGQCHPIAITAKFIDPQTFVEIGHVVPAPVSPDTEKRIYDFCSAIVTALGIQHGATHTEIILTADGPHCVETHVRLGGDDIPRLVQDATSVCLEHELARDITGREYSGTALESPPRLPQAAAIWFSLAPDAGVLAGVQGLEEAREHEGVRAIELLTPVGTQFHGIASSHDRIVSVRAVGPDPSTALLRARTAAESISVTMDVSLTPSTTLA